MKAIVKQSVKQLMQKLASSEKPQSNLEAGLAAQSLDHLQRIAGYLPDIPADYTNKEFLVKIIAAKLQSDWLEDFLAVCSPDTMQTLHCLLKKPIMRSDTFFEYFGLIELIKTGIVLIYREKEGFAAVLAEDLKSQISVFLDRIGPRRQTAQQVIEMLYAAVNLYGVIRKEEFCRIWHHYERETLAESFFERLLAAWLGLQIDIQCMDDILVDTANYQSLAQVQELLQKQENVTPYLPRKEKFLAYREVDHFGKNPALEKLAGLIREKHSLGPSEYQTLHTELYFQLREGAAKEDIRKLLSEYHIVLSALENGEFLLSAMIEHARQHALRGHSLDELKGS